jgi:hypothetical protein
VLDEDMDETLDDMSYQKLWDEIIDELQNCDEVLEGEP